MLDDFKTAKATLSKLRQDIDAINRVAKSAYLSELEQMDRTMKLFRHNQLKIGRALDMSGVAVWVKDIIEANQRWQGMLEQVTMTSRMAESVRVAHQSWIERINSIQRDLSQYAQIQASAKLILCDVSLQLTVTERLMAEIDFEAIRSHFQIEIPVISGLENSIVNAAAEYGNLAESMREITDIIRLPDFVLPGATREIYTTSFALKTLRTLDERGEEEAELEIQLVAEAELETSDCIALLKQVDPRLALPYVGARDAFSGNSADRVRHILSSLRELWNHLLRRLAPDESVAAWISGNVNQEDLLDKGKPTRRARVMYVCRELSNDPLTEFVMHDTRALMKLIELFNRVHELESKLTDEQLRAILLKTDSWLMYILQIWLQASKK